jgi:hypothetical protein
MSSGLVCCARGVMRCWRRGSGTIFIPRLVSPLLSHQALEEEEWGATKGAWIVALQKRYLSAIMRFGGRALLESRCQCCAKLSLHCERDYQHRSSTRSLFTIDTFRIGCRRCMCLLVPISYKFRLKYTRLDHLLPIDLIVLGPCQGYECSLRMK